MFSYAVVADSLQPHDCSLSDSSVHGIVRRVYAPRFFVSSQQRFGVTGIKAPSPCHSSRVLDRLCYTPVYDIVLSGECILLGSVSSQERFGVMDIKALGVSQLSGLGQTMLEL